MNEQYPGPSTAEQAMMLSYDYFMTLMSREPLTAARLALETLNLWSNAAQPPQKEKQSHEQRIQHTNAGAD